MTIGINGMAHVILTVSRFEVAREFYRKLLPEFGNAPTVINLAGSAGPMSRHGLATHMQSRPDQRAGYGQFRPFWGDVIPETSGPVRPSSSSPSPRPSPETHQGKIEAFLARCTVPRRGRGGDLLTFCSGVWVRALFAYGTRSAVRRMTTPVGICISGSSFF